MAVMLTDNAANQVKKFREEHQFGDEMFLRIGVAGGGCSGFNYTLAFDDKFDEAADSRYEYHGVAVVVDKKSACTWTERPSIGTTVSKSRALRLTIPTRSRAAVVVVRSPLSATQDKKRLGCRLAAQPFCLSLAVQFFREAYVRPMWSTITRRSASGSISP